MKIFFVFNPRAGKGTIKSKLGEIIELFCLKGHSLAVAATTKRGDARELVANLPEGYDRVVCAGGDGTLDEVVQGMIDRENRIPIGYIPAGSTNDFAKSLGLPTRLIDAAKASVSGNLFPCDIGEFNNHSFVYCAAFGAFTEVSYATPQEIKNVLGYGAYIVEALKALNEIQSYRMVVETDHMRIEDEFIYGMITNSDSIGGIKKITGENICLNDGLFEVTLVRKPENAGELNSIIAGLMNREYANKGLYYFKTDYIHFSSTKDIPWTLDGEFGGKVKEVEIKNHKQELMIAIKE